MVVRDIMSKNVVAIAPEDPVDLAARLMARNNIGALPVCTPDGKLRGIVTDRDITLRCIASGNDPSATSVREIMSRSVVFCTPDTDTAEASKLMAASQIRRLPVVDGDRLMGIVSLGDFARRPALDMEAARALSDISVNIRRARKPPEGRSGT